MKQNGSQVHIGHIIREQLLKDERSVSWLARQIHCTRNHLYKVFRKASLDCELLLRISKAMNFNFFQFYAAEIRKENEKRIGEDELRTEN